MLDKVYWVWYNNTVVKEKYMELLILIGLMILSAEMWFQYRMNSVRKNFFEQFKDVISSAENYDSQVRNEIITELLKDEVLKIGENGVLIGYNNNKSYMLNKESM